jgi:hypothetical protein
MSSSKARRAQFSPRSKVLRAATSSSSLESSPSSEVVAHEVQASSRGWASTPAMPCYKDAPVSSASWISGEAVLVVISGATRSWTGVEGSSGT